MTVFKKRKLGFRIWQNQEIGKQPQDKDMIEYRGLPMTVSINVSLELTTANVRIMGLSRDLILNLITFKNAFGRSDSWSPNLMHIFEYDEVTGEINIIFKGGITIATADFNMQPTVPLIMTVENGAALRLQPFNKSVEGKAKVKDIANEVCKKIGYSFKAFPTELGDKTVTDFAERNDVWTVLRNLATQIPAQMIITNDEVRFHSTTLKGDSLKTLAPKAEISRTRGMIGYPRFVNVSEYSVEVIFNGALEPCDLVHLVAPEVGVEGFCTILSASHTLSSEVGGTQWKSQFLLMHRRELGN